MLKVGGTEGAQLVAALETEVAAYLNAGFGPS